MREKRWVFAPTDRGASARLARALDIAPVTATLLVNRGIREPAEARRFLHPDLAALRDPLSLEDMGGAVDRILAALRGGEKIGIFGDYDVDGTAGTAILVRFLSLMGHVPAYRVPHRISEGYGLNAAAVEDFASEGVKVLVAVDCGTGNLEEIALARERGMDVIVVDHHEPGPGLPPAVALVNPKRRDSGYEFTGLCSAVLAFKLAWALADRSGARRRRGFEDFILDGMALAALGTVADVCPLSDENRVFVRYGLDALRACRAAGLRALLKKVIREDRPLDTFDIAFKLAPRLNALGRLGSAMECVELLVGGDEARIAEILASLEKSNRSRKGIEDGIFSEACDRVERERHDGAIVVAGEGWHPGVVGIVAARLVQRYCRPAFVLAIERDVARGSGRSVQGFPLHEALESCDDVLLTHGGHAMAAGVTLKAEKLKVFQDLMQAHAAQHLTAEHLQPRLDVDEEVSLKAVTKPVVRELERLAPHGVGNPPPTLVVSHVRVAGEARLMGKKGSHLSFYVSQEGASLRAVGFRMGELLEPLRKARTVSLAFRPKINAWRGSETVELQLEDAKFHV